MGIQKQDLDRVAAAALHWAYARGTEGYYAGAKYAGLDIEIGAQQDTPSTRERAAFDHFAKSIHTLRDKVSQGEESKEADAVTERRTIKTLEELDALPNNSVVLEDQYGSVAQKRSRDDWLQDGFSIPARQIDLPVTVIYEPGVR